jgi:hypothetical protein
MRAATVAKIKMIEDAKGNTVCRIELRQGKTYEVSGLKRLGGDLVRVELPRRMNQDGGFLFIDGEDILSVWVPRLPQIDAI